MTFFTDIINNIQENYMGILVSIVYALVYVVLGLIFIALYKKLIRRILRINTGDKRRATIAKVIISIGKYVIWFLIFMLVLGAFHIDTAPILGSAAILGLAVGLGAQKLVADFISGFFILFEDSFSIGDVVKIDGFKGEVVDIGLRTTKLLDWTGTMKVVNNGDIHTVENYSKFNSIAIIDFGVAYETDLDNMKQIINEFFESKSYTHEAMINSPKYLGVIKMNASDIECRVIVECEPMGHFQVERDLRNELKKLFEENGIEIPFPQLVIQNKTSQ